MRPLVLTCSTFATLLLALSSRGDEKAPPSPASTPPIEYHALPEGHMARMPSRAERPESIPAGMKAPGIFAVRGDRRGMPAEYTMVSVVGSEAMARSIQGKGSGSEDEKAAACVTTDRRDADDEDAPWQGGGSTRDQIAWQITHTARSKRFGDRNPRVQAAHVERLARSPDGKTATLDWADAWLDASTGGAKPIAKGSMSLTRVAMGPTGLEVFAARDEGLVHFVVRNGDIEGGDESGMRRMFGKQLQAVVPDNLGGLMTDCGFMRVTLPAAAASDQMATLQTQALLPPLHPPPPVDENADPIARMRALRETRRRELRVNVSSTQATADPEPLVSVSFGWGGKEER
jgi:hypothetical protein